MSKSSGAGFETRALSQVQQDEKKSTSSIMFIWIGMMITATTLILGATLAASMSIPMVLLVTLIAFTIAVFIMTLNGMQASDTGFPLSILLGKVFGETGSRFAASVVLGITQIGWFAIQAAVCGSAFTVMFESFGIAFPVWLSSAIWGAVMLITAVVGFNWMKWLNYVAVPLLVLACGLSLVMSFNQFGTEPLQLHIPDGSISFIGALAMLIGFFANCMLIVCDITRYAKNRKSVAISSFVGVIPVTLFLIGIGAVMGIIAGTADIAVIFAKMGLPVLGALALIVAAWTSNSTTIYSAGLAILRLTGLKDDKRTVVTAIAGIIGTIMAAAGIMDYFQDILVLLSVLTPPIAGLMVADYWILGKGNRDKWGIIPGVNWVGICSWVCGTLVGLFVPYGSAALNSVMVSMAAFIVFTKLAGDKIPTAKAPTEEMV